MATRSATGGSRRSACRMPPSSMHSWTRPPTPKRPPERASSMTYSPHTEADRARMLDAIGVASVDDLFDDIPAAVRAGPWSVPAPLAEQEVRAELPRLAGRNRLPEVSCLGAGVSRP